MTADNSPMGNTESVSRLNILHFAQLQGFAAQQTAQTGPTCNPEYDAEKQQAQIRPRGNGIEQLRTGFDIYLHHQYCRRDQQNTGNRTQRRIQVLNHIIHPATEISRRDAQKQRKRQHHQRGKRSDHEPGANAFQRLVKNVLPHLVGTEDMVIAA